MRVIGRDRAPSWSVRCLAVLTVLAGALGLAACGGSGSTQSKGKAGPAPGIAGHAMQETLPAEIDPHPQGFASADLMRPVNAWRTSNHQRFTEVDAGVLSRDSSVGAFFIFRHEFVHASQRVDLVKVLGSGAVHITGAPQGAAVETSAQRNGMLSFVGARGVRGTLDLSDDTVTLKPARPGG
jgi:hypothetical protein